MNNENRLEEIREFSLVIKEIIQEFIDKLVWNFPLEIRKKTAESCKICEAKAYLDNRGYCYECADSIDGGYCEDATNKLDETRPKS